MLDFKTRRTFARPDVALLDRLIASGVRVTVHYDSIDGRPAAATGRLVERIEKAAVVVHQVGTFGADRLIVVHLDRLRAVETAPPSTLWFAGTDGE
ncbi:MAG: hypothetical protein HSCHL_0534 [Hydrogenibacillus schlegelii]|uniref:Uncharacterized protein n=1 Tax=Hydrogenibacillus schlegelii TaxID=1484 RepID=A0A2T5GDL6_HYDSH|nr:hypothetical protein [Hydrogenibacillus schlegelii]PTQ54255.1 MAG: hypothetical protein HSCHL_0534 [Hydrogenibacillus schlegelii]